MADPNMGGLWEGYKSKICHLYSDHTLAEVARVMSDEHNFKPNVRTYRRKFHKWGFRKNNAPLRSNTQPPSEQVWDSRSLPPLDSFATNGPRRQSAPEPLPTAKSESSRDTQYHHHTTHGWSRSTDDVGRGQATFSTTPLSPATFENQKMAIRSLEHDISHTQSTWPHPPFILVDVPFGGDSVDNYQVVDFNHVQEGPVQSSQLYQVYHAMQNMSDSMPDNFRTDDDSVDEIEFMSPGTVVGMSAASSSVSLLQDFIDSGLDKSPPI